MKNGKTGILFLMIFFVSSIICASNGPLSYTPLKPKPGDKIQIMYDARNTVLKDKNKIDLHVFCYSIYGEISPDNIKKKILIEMRKEGDVWKGVMECGSNIDLVGILPSSDTEFDNNNGEGYIIKFYDNEGNETPGSILGYAAALTGNYFSFFIKFTKTDFNEAYTIMKKVFNIFPKLKAPMAVPLLKAIQKLKGVNTDSLINSELGNVENDPQVNEEYLITLQKYITGKNDSVRSAQIKDLTLQKFPIGFTSRTLRSEEIDDEPDFNKKIDLAFKLDEKWHSWFAKNINYTTFPEQVLSSAATEKRTDLIKQIYDRMINNCVDLSYFHPTSNIDEMIKNDVALDIAIDWGKRYEKYLETNYVSWALRENEIPIQQREQVQEMIKNEIKKILGMMYYAKGEKDEADKYLSNVPLDEYFEWQNANTKEIILNYFIEKKKYDTAKVCLEKAVSSGKIDDVVKKYLKEIYVIGNKNDKGYEEYYSKLVKSSAVEIKNKLSAELLNNKAPEIELKDLEGNTVSLAKLKGKIVILDFWATWCGPCKASFPAMQKAVDTYKNNKDIVFLFINTFENVKDKKQNAKKFIDKMKYTFHVLLDEENKAANDYGVGGIPTKVVIGKDGNIKFKKSGGSSFEEELLTEIATMIELASKQI